MIKDNGLSRSFGYADVSTDERRRLIRRTFQEVAPRYDLMNDLMSLGAHRAWKAQFIKIARPEPGAFVVDLAGGTGDVAFALAKRGARVLIVDPSSNMMRAGMSRPDAAHVGWIAAEGERLPFQDNSVDLLTISFGIRNMTRIDDALTEIARVLKPSGRFLCLEFSTPAAWLKPFYDLWSRTAIPALGAVVSGRRDAYRYLVQSIRRFPDQREFAKLLGNAGLTDIGWRNLSFGVVAIHGARKPPP